MEDAYRVMVIDDAAFIAKVVEKALKPYNFEIAGYAGNGKLGLELFEKIMPDVVVLDITMPEMDGLEVAEHLFKKDPKPKVVMLSALGGHEHYIERAKEIGVEKFLIKPFKDNELIDAIMSLLKQ